MRLPRAQSVVATDQVFHSIYESLALIAVPLLPSEKWKDRPLKDQEERADKLRSDEILMEFIHRWEANLKRFVPAARIVEMPGAHHYLFPNEQAAVLPEVHAFLTTLH